ncbi:MAG: YegS/Rv2252/BmrU family lipid kinase [Ginsengibacter sp.]
MSRKILFFINPISGTRNKSSLKKDISARCTEKEVEFEICHTSADGNYDFLPEKIRVENITDVVIAGGDGSLGPIIKHLLHTNINVGILPMGSGNGVATAAGIPKKLDKALEIILNGNASAVDAFLVNGQLSCQITGLGFDAQVAHDFAKQKKRGLNTYIKQFLKNFISAKTWLFETEIEGKFFQEKAFCVCVANSNQFGNNFTIAPKASLSDGLLDIIIVKKTSKPVVIIEMVKQVFLGEIKSVHSKGLGNKNILYFQTGKLTIKNLDHAPLHIDGDPCETTSEFIIEILPAAYKLIQPE